MILLDTSVLSEPLRPAANRSVVDWIDRCDEESVISVVTVFELVSGVALLPAGRRRDQLDNIVEQLLRRFTGRIYAFDEMAARAAARLRALARAQGKGAHTLPEKLADLQIAGTAAAYGLSLATRNIRDFEPFGLKLIDPWQAT
jgi:predicted nucleic acid-binding protein